MKNFLVPDFVKRYRKIYKEQGFKAVLKKGGWKLVVGLFMFYLIRDVILYLLIPYLVAKGLLS